MAMCDTWNMENTAREQIALRAADLIESDTTATRADAEDIAWNVLAAVLPQIATVNELEALPRNTLLVDGANTLFRVVGDGRYAADHRIDTAESLSSRFPLTVAWRPSA